MSALNLHSLGPRLDVKLLKLVRRLHKQILAAFTPLAIAEEGEEGLRVVSERLSSPPVVLKAHFSTSLAQ